MASEVRRLAKALVSERTESFASRHPRDESERRLRSAVERFDPRGLEYHTAWRDSPTGLQLDVTFKPSQASRRFLHRASILLTLLIASTAYAYLSDWARQSERIMLVLVTLLSIFAFPFVVVAYGSRREAEEASLRRTLRQSLVEEPQP